MRDEGFTKEPAPKQVQEEPFSIEEYKELAGKGSFDTGDPLTTNLYVGNINPKVRVKNQVMRLVAREDSNAT